MVLEVSEGDVFVGQNGDRWYVIQEDKILENQKDAVEVHSKIAPFANPEIQKAELDQMRQSQPPSGFISTIDKRAGFVHTKSSHPGACQEVVVEMKDFFQVGGEISAKALRSGMLTALSQGGYTVASLLDVLLTIRDVKEYHPVEWFENIEEAEQLEGAYYCTKCNKPINLH